MIYINLRHVAVSSLLHTDLMFLSTATFPLPSPWMIKSYTCRYTSVAIALCHIPLLLMHQLFQLRFLYASENVNKSRWMDGRWMEALSQT